jgi:hypothetical protein
MTPEENEEIKKILKKAQIVLFVNIIVFVIALIISKIFIL